MSYMNLRTMYTDNCKQHAHGIQRKKQMKLKRKYLYWQFEIIFFLRFYFLFWILCWRHSDTCKCIYSTKTQYKTWRNQYMILTLKLIFVLILGPCSRKYPKINGNDWVMTVFHHKKKFYTLIPCRIWTSELCIQIIARNTLMGIDVLNLRQVLRHILC
jgi:hypothetical protein